MKLEYGKYRQKLAVRLARNSEIKFGECHEWTGPKDGNGYGRTVLWGVSIGAHRVSWLVEHGEIPDGLHVLHRCDNPPCINPDHLFLGTHQDNMADKAKKGRCNSHPRFPDQVIAKVFEELRAGTPQKEIAAKLGVSKSHVSRISKGGTRKRVLFSVSSEAA